MKFETMFVFFVMIALSMLDNHNNKARDARIDALTIRVEKLEPKPKTTPKAVKVRREDPPVNQPFRTRRNTNNPAGA